MNKKIFCGNLAYLCDLIKKKCDVCLLEVCPIRLSEKMRENFHRKSIRSETSRNLKRLLKNEFSKTLYVFFDQF